MKNEKVVCRYDEIINTTKAAAEMAVSRLETVLNEAGQIGLSMTHENWRRIASSPKEHIKYLYLDKVQECDLVTPSGLKQRTRETVAETALSLEMEKYVGFMQACEQLINFLDEHSVSSSFLAIANGKAEINADAMMDLIENNTVYASSPKEIKLLDEMQKVADQINSFNEMLRKEYGFNQFNSSYHHLNEMKQVDRTNYVTILNELTLGQWLMWEKTDPQNLAPKISRYLEVVRSLQD